MNGSLLTTVLFVVLSVSGSAPDKVRFVNYGSPWTKHRSARETTKYIILHTTEGAERGALEKLSREGEAHYLVGRDGTIYRIVQHHRIATHTGLSMWEGITDLDNYTLGIEVAGYHNTPPTPEQLVALNELIRQLQSIYNISDDRVLTHSMVAYGTPNRWHRRPHRGRKRCAMHLADPKLRAQMGLTERPKRDPDVYEGQLIVADRRLHSSLYPTKEVHLDPSPSVARRKHTSTAASFSHSIRATLVAAGILDPSPPTPPKRTRSPPVDRAKISSSFPQPHPSHTRVDDPIQTTHPSKHIITLRPHENALMVLNERYNSRYTIYLFPHGLVRTGAQLEEHPRLRSLLRRSPEGTKILVDYHYGGYITARRPPSVVCGNLWNDSSTIYRMPNGHLRSGETIDPDLIPRGTLVFFRARR